MEPSPALNASVLEAILNVDMRAAPPNHEVWNQLIQRMADRDAARVPSAFDRTLPLLAGDVDRLRLATDLIVSFDIYEAMPSLLNLARKLKSSDLALAAAAFASHPGVPESTARIAREELVGIVDMSASQREAFDIRTEPSYQARSDRGAELKRAMWPGADSEVPIIYVVERDAPARLQLMTLGLLREEGVRVRRIPAQPNKTPPPSWFGNRAPVVTWTENTVSLLRSLGLEATAGQIVLGPRSDKDFGGFSRRIENRLGRPWISVKATHPFPLEHRILTPESLTLGSFDIREMAYLGGGRLSTLYDLSKRGRLLPRYLPSGHHNGLWSFAQLIAFRTWRVLALRAGARSFPSRLVSEFEGLASSVHVAEVAVTADGRLLERDPEQSVENPDRGGWHDRDTGQEVFEEVLTIDRVFQPFELGGGRVPHLAKPSRLTRVDPAIAGGTPTVQSARIAARAIAEVVSKQGREAAGYAYPELSSQELADGLQVGLQVLGQV